MTVDEAGGVPVYEKLDDFLEQQGAKLCPAAEQVFAAEADPVTGRLAGDDYAKARAVFGHREWFTRMRVCVEAGLSLGPAGYRLATVLHDLFIRFQADVSLDLELAALDLERQAKLRGFRIISTRGVLGFDDVWASFQDSKSKASREEAWTKLRELSSSLAATHAQVIATRNRLARELGSRTWLDLATHHLGVASGSMSQLRTWLDTEARPLGPTLAEASLTCSASLLRQKHLELQPENSADPLLLWPSRTYVQPQDSEVARADRQVARLLARLGWPATPGLECDRELSGRKSSPSEPWRPLAVLLGQLRVHAWRIVRALVPDAIPEFLRPSFSPVVGSAIEHLLARSLTDREALSAVLGVAPRRAVALRQLLLKELGLRERAAVFRAAFAMRWLHGAYVQPGRDLLASWKELLPPSAAPLARAAHQPIWALDQDIFHPGLLAVRDGMGALMASGLATTLANAGPGTNFLSHEAARDFLCRDLLQNVIIEGLESGYQRSLGRSLWSERLVDKDRQPTSASDR